MKESGEIKLPLTSIFPLNVLTCLGTSLDRSNVRRTTCLPYRFVDSLDFLCCVCHATSASSHEHDTFFTLVFLYMTYVSAIVGWTSDCNKYLFSNLAGSSILKGSEMSIDLDLDSTRIQVDALGHTPTPF